MVVLPGEPTRSLNMLIFAQLRLWLERPSAWTMALLLALVSIALFGQLSIGANESSYLILSKVLMDAEFLQFDWETSVRLGGAATSMLFDVLAVPFWYLTDNPAVVALAVRILVSAGVILSIVMLTRALGLPYLPAALGLCLWLVWQQSLAADEWILGGAEKKVLAYVFGLAGLSYLLRDRFIAAGVAGGLAAGCHLLVGGWLCVVWAIALLYKQRKLSIDLIRYCIAVAVVAAPFVLMSVLFVMQAPGGSLSFGGYTTAELITLWRNPHHANPLNFLGSGEWIEAAVFFLMALVAVRYSLEGSERRLVQGIVLAVALLWSVTLLAAAFEVHFVLYLFPARVGDVLIPFLFALTAPQALLHLSSRLFEKQIALRPMLATAGLLGLCLWMVHDAHHYTLRKLNHTVDSWQQALQAKPLPYAGVAAWIRGNTRPQDLFIAPLGSEWFKLNTGRPLLITMKGSPGNPAIHEWFCRLYRMNGSRPFSALGYTLVRETDDYLTTIPAPTLLDLAHQFGASYYLSQTDRQDLHLPRVYSDQHYTVYRLGDGSLPAASPNCLSSLRADEQLVLEDAFVH